MRKILMGMVVCAVLYPTLALSNSTHIIEDHVLAGYQELATTSKKLATIAQTHCHTSSESIHRAYHQAFDAWALVSHLRFGPAEVDNRAFALAFWPDPRGSTPKALALLLREQDEAVNNPDYFRTVSVAARGFYALEFLLFDPQFINSDSTAFRCALIIAIAGDIADNARSILKEWLDGYAELMTQPGNETYQSESEVVRQLFTSLSTGLEFTAEVRLGRPLGTFDRPRPRRAETRRSERSLRHVILSLEATRDLASRMSNDDSSLDRLFSDALQRATNLEDPTFEGVSNPQSRFRIEALQQSIQVIRGYIDQKLGPSLGISAGFNSLDGD